MYISETLSSSSSDIYASSSSDFMMESNIRPSLTNLLKLPKDEVKSFIDSIDTVMTDCDGVLWLESHTLEGAPEVMARFKELGKKIFYVTNNSTRLRDEFVEKATKFGFNCTKEEVVSTAHLAANYLKDLGFNKKVYVVGKKGITQELDLVGIKHLDIGPDIMPGDWKTFVEELKLDPEVGAVIVGFDDHISYPKMLKAASYLKDPNCIFVATNTDEVFPMASSLVVPGSGTMVQAVKTCAGREYVLMGKPSTYIKDVIMKKHKIDPKRTLMIGDRCNTDILFGNRCGFYTLLVLTGISQYDEVKIWKESKLKEENALVPTFFMDKLGDLLPFLN